MTKEEYRPSKVEMLASLIAGTANQSHTMATVQRSHRFPLHIFTQIEKLALRANVPISVIINELIECGLDAVKKELPPDFVQELRFFTDEDRKKRTVIDKFDSESYRAKTVKKRKARE